MAPVAAHPYMSIHPRAIAQEDESIRIMQGSLYDPSAFERGNYRKVLSLYRPEDNSSATVR